MPDPALDLDDIQGNILGGFNTAVQVFVALTMETAADVARANIWLASQADSLTSVAQVRSLRPAMRSLDSTDVWLFMAVGKRIIDSLSDVYIRDTAFQVGLVARAKSVLGDETKPSDWCVGSPDTPLDVLVLTASNDKGAAERRADALVADARQFGLKVGFRETGCRLPNEIEHFGFRDGVSQPTVTGFDPNGELGAGHFVFGYPREPGTDAVVQPQDERKLSLNGSFLVFRRLAQDVPAFRAHWDTEVARLAVQWPQLTAAHLAALIVGRWPSGAPIVSGQTADPDTGPADDFDFKNDKLGEVCPFGAHIRKVNPRKGAASDVTKTPRLLRRGIPFGPMYDAEPATADRGLTFLAFQTSINGQFEKITLDWMNSATAPGRGHDVLVGRGKGRRVLSVHSPSGPVEVAAPDVNWIKPTGGAYLFAPGKRGLKQFDQPPASLGFWKARQLIAVTTDTIKAKLFE